MTDPTSNTDISGATDPTSLSLLHTPEHLISTLLTLTETSIIPLTRTRVSQGNKLFGAAILSRSDLTPHTISTNNESVSPLFHAEINCIQSFFTHSSTSTPDPSSISTLDADNRPSTSNCIFYATHEPCSLCLSGITWSGFNEFYYLFTYEDSRDLFKIPYDIEILREVYRVRADVETEEQLEKRELYNRRNKFFNARSVESLLEVIGDMDERERLRGEIRRVKALYGELSEVYQRGKEGGTESASFFK